MKKYIKILLILFVFILSFYKVSANSEALIYKKISITNTEIVKIYGEEKGKKVILLIDKYFINLRGDKNLDKLGKIEENMGKVLKELNNKKTLSKKDRNLKTIVENLYYRSKILSDYILK